jgi:hypothetical protein
MALSRVIEVSHQHEIRETCYFTVFNENSAVSLIS